MSNCAKKCRIKKLYAKVFDIHFDCSDCPIKCPYKNVIKEVKPNEIN